MDKTGVCIIVFKLRKAKLTATDVKLFDQKSQYKCLSQNLNPTFQASISTLSNTVPSTKETIKFSLKIFHFDWIKKYSEILLK